MKIVLDKKNFMNIEENLLWSHQTLRKSVMVTSNIKKICYGHIKHFEKTVMDTSNIENI